MAEERGQRVSVALDEEDMYSSAQRVPVAAAGSKYVPPALRGKAQGKGAAKKVELEEKEEKEEKTEKTEKMEKEEKTEKTEKEEKTEKTEEPKVEKEKELETEKEKEKEKETDMEVTKDVVQEGASKAIETEKEKTKLKLNPAAAEFRPTFLATPPAGLPVPNPAIAAAVAAAVLPPYQQQQPLQ